MSLAMTFWGVVGSLAAFMIGAAVSGYIFALSGRWDDDTADLVIIASGVGVLSAIGEAIFGFWTWKWIAFAPCVILFGWLAIVSVKLIIPIVRGYLVQRRERKAQEERVASEARERAEKAAADQGLKDALEKHIQEVREREERIAREDAERKEQERLMRAQREEQEREQRETEERKRQVRRMRLREARLSAPAATEFRNLAGQRKSELRELFRKHGLKTFDREWALRVITKADNHLESPYASIRSRFNIKHKALVLEVVFTPDRIVMCRFGKASVSNPDWSAALRFFDAELNTLLPVATGA